MNMPTAQGAALNKAAGNQMPLTVTPAGALVPTRLRLLDQLAIAVAAAASS